MTRTTSATRAASPQHCACESARCTITITRTPTHVAQVTFSGVITSRSMDQFRQTINAATQDAMSMLLDFSRALLAMDILDLETSQERFTNRTVIVIVTEEHHMQAFAYASKMARLGVFRDINLPQESVKALQLADFLGRPDSLREFVLGPRAQVR